MSGCGFEKPSSAQRVAVNKCPTPLLRERAIETGARLASGDTEQEARRVQVAEHLPRAREERYHRILREVVVAIAGDEIGLPRRR